MFGEEKLYFGDVLDFIEENSDVFSILERDLESVAAENVRITSEKKALMKQRGKDAKVQKPEFAREYEEDASITKELYSLNGQEKRLKNLNEIFYDFLLNHFETVRAGGEFKFTYGRIFDDKGHMRLANKREKLVYASTMFCIVFNYKFTQSIDLSSFERFLRENDLIFIKLEKGKAARIRTELVNVTEEGHASFTTYLSEMGKFKKNNYMHASQMLSDLARERKTKIKGGRYYPNRETFYKVMSGENDFERVFPKSLQNGLDNLLERNTTVKLPSDIGNEFVINAILAGMESNLSRVFYRGFKKNIMDAKENEDKNEDYKTFMVMYLLVKKYGYKKFSEAKYIEERDSKKLFEVGFLNNPEYGRLLELDKRFTVAYIDNHLKKDYYDTSSVLPLSLAFIMISKAKRSELPYILENTSKSLEYFMEWQLKLEKGGEDWERLKGLYSVEGVKTKKLFREIKEQFRLYYYKLKSNEYKTFPLRMKQQIAKNFFRDTVLMETRLKFYSSRLPEEEARTNDHFENIMRDISEVFSMKL